MGQQATHGAERWKKRGEWGRPRHLGWINHWLLSGSEAGRVQWRKVETRDTKNGGDWRKMASRNKNRHNGEKTHMEECYTKPAEMNSAEEFLWAPIHRERNSLKRQAQTNKRWHNVALLSGTRRLQVTGGLYRLDGDWPANWQLDLGRLKTYFLPGVFFFWVIDRTRDS